MTINGETLVASQVISYKVYSKEDKGELLNRYGVREHGHKPIYSREDLLLIIQIRTAHPELLIESTEYPEGTDLTAKVAAKQAELATFINPTITL